MNRYLVPRAWRSFEHMIFSRLQLLTLEPHDITSDGPREQRCVTRLGEPVCSCGHYILEWEVARDHGVSQGSDGANA